MRRAWFASGIVHVAVLTLLLWMLLRNPEAFGFWDTTRQDTARWDRIDFDWETIVGLAAFLVAGLAAGLTRSVPTEKSLAFALLSSLAFAFLYVELNALDNMLAPDPTRWARPDDNVMAFTFGALYRTLALGALTTIPTLVGLFTGKAISSRPARQ